MTTIWDRLEAHFKALTEKETRPEIDLAALQAKLEARAKALRKAGRAEAPRRQFEALFFRTGPEAYALRVEEIDSVHALSNFTTAPGAPAYLQGLAHVRGEILSLLDIGLFLSVERKGLADLRRVLVIGRPPRRLALLAGEVEDIVCVPEDALSPPLRRTGTERESCVEGVIGGDRLLLSGKEILGMVGSERG